MANILNQPEMMREVIMDHYQYPRNHALVKDDASYQEVHMASDSCIDDIYVQAKFNGKNIEDIRFDGIACTIATSSTSIMSELLKGKSTDEARCIMQEYQKMIDGQPYDEDMLEEAVVFQNVGKQANRIKCATIGWHAMEQLIEESEK